GLDAAANAIVAAWHGGFVGNTLISYPGALAWKALPFLKPAGYCGGAFGYWAEAPQ
ncbi:sugar dehydrogenase complex small subunit, partial [Methylogaea oryzae]